ncbi:hypothetical protein [Dyadobacter sp. CY356]|uniref:hypothetical protein n=1 Tax=Dyadobacter sp. CY356 TaxID=2906442 RepID=UPI001F490A2B|nr:hypothetical protein [Dyadobacter sp. CY356]MCF0059134.1 hypothetical protein [Dyadobacter sp. CY356]
MKQFISKSKGIILLLILLAAGWLVYKSKKTVLSEKKHPQHHISPEKQLIISGVILKYGSNHDGDIDKILLSKDDKKVWLHFPPHTARQVTAAAGINHTIEATVSQKELPGHDKQDRYELKYLQSKDSKILLDLSQIPAPLPRKGLEVEIKGKPSKDFSIEDGRENSFVLEGKLVSLPPHMARTLLPLISQAKIIIVKGQMRDSTEGFLSLSRQKIVKPSSIQIDSVTYKIR